MELAESCLGCKLRASGFFFCDLPERALEALDRIRHPTVYPKGAVLCVEGEHPRGVFMVCQGRVKLSTSSADGSVLITRIAEAGEVIGLSAAISGRPYEVTAETLEPCQINFIRQDAFLDFLTSHCEVCLQAAQHLSDNYHTACEQIRLLGLSHSAAGRLAMLILEWCARHGKVTSRGIKLTLTLTHEEISHLIGVSRETVTRIFSEFKNEGIIEVKGATLWVCDQAALEALVNS